MASKVIFSAAAISIIAALAIVGPPESTQGDGFKAVASVGESACANHAQAQPENTGQLDASQPGGLPFPVDIDVSFQLTDHFGNQVTEASYRCRPMLVFFGYASCEAICTVALPRMGEALALMGDQGKDVEALMITVDPDRDTPEAMQENLKRWHPRLVGLTGDEMALAEARQRFQVNLEIVAEDPTGAPIYAHGSFIYLIDGNGELKTMIPPILGPERIAELAQKYF